MSFARRLREQQEERRRLELLRLQGIQDEIALQDARRNVAAQAEPEPAPEPEAPETPMETETETHTTQEAGADGSGAKEVVKRETSRPFDVQPTGGQGAPAQAQPRSAPEETRQTNPEWVKAAGEGTADVAKAPLRGVLEAVDETEDFVMNVTGDLLGAVERDEQGMTGFDRMMGEAKEVLAYNDPEAMAPQLVEGMVQFLVPYMGVAKALKAAGMAGSVGKAIGRSLTADVVASLVAIDPYEERLSTFLNQIPALADFVPDYLAMNDEDASHWEGRFKNVIEGGALGLASEGVIAALRLMRVGHKAAQVEPPKPDDAAARQVERDKALDEVVQGLESERAGVAKGVAERATGKQNQAPTTEPPAKLTPEQIRLIDPYDEQFAEDAAELAARGDPRELWTPPTTPLTALRTPSVEATGILTGAQRQSLEEAAAKLRAQMDAGMEKIDARIREEDAVKAAAPEEPPMLTAQMLRHVRPVGDMAVPVRQKETVLRLTQLFEEGFTEGQAELRALTEQAATYARTVVDEVVQQAEALQRVELVEPVAAGHAASALSRMRQGAERSKMLRTASRQRRLNDPRSPEHLLLAKGKDVMRALNEVANVVPPSEIVLGRKVRKGGLSGMARDVARHRMLQASLVLRRNVAEYRALRGEVALPDMVKRADVEARVSPGAKRGEEVPEGSLGEGVVRQAGEAARETTKALWRNEPMGNRPFEPSLDTSMDARTTQVLTQSVKNPPDAETLFGRADAGQAVEDMRRGERDAKTIEPLLYRREHAGGIEDRVETETNPGFTVSPGFGSRIEDFDEIPAHIEHFRGPASAEANRAARQGLEGLRADLGYTEDGQYLQSWVKVGDEAAHLEAVHVMANDLRRAAGRAIAGVRDAESIVEVALRRDRLEAYASKLFDSPEVARDRYRSMSSGEREAYYALDDAGRRKAAVRWVEKAGASVHVQMGTFRAANSLEELLTAVKRYGEVPPSTRLPRRIVQAVIHARAAGLLSALTTHGKNIIGSTSNLAMRVPVTMVSARLRTGGWGGPAFEEVGALLEGYKAGLRGTFSFANKSRIHLGYAKASTRAAQEEALMGSKHGALLQLFARNDKFDLDQGQAAHQQKFGSTALSGGRVGILAEAVHAAEDMHEGFGQVVRAASGYFSAIMDAPLTGLRVEDMALKQNGYEGEIYRLATLEAKRQMRGGAIDVEQYSEIVDDIVESSHKSGHRYHALHEAALEAAEDITFTQKLNPMNQKVLDGLNRIGGGAGRIVVPFYTVLMNMGRQSLTWLPMYQRLARRMSPKVRRQLEVMERIAREGGTAGLVANVKLHDLQARQWIGAGALTVAGGLYAAGVLTGGSPSKGQFRRAHGQLQQHYSLRLGDTFIGDYRELFPGVGAIIAMGVDAIELGQSAMDGEEASIAEVGTAMVMQTMGNLMSQTAIVSMADFLDDVGKLAEAHRTGRLDTQGTAIAVRHLQGVAASILPYSAFTRRLGDAMRGGPRMALRGAQVDEDGTLLGLHQQLFDGLKKEIQARMWWTSDDGPTIRGWDGEPLTRQAPGSHSGVMAGVAAFMNPLTMMAANSRDPSVRAMLDNDTAPDWVDRRFHMEAAGVKIQTPLLPAEYDWLSERRGKLIRQGLDRLTRTDWFQSLGPGLDQESLLKSIFLAAERQAEAELRARFPNIDQRLHRRLGNEMDRLRAQAAARQEAA